MGLENKARVFLLHGILVPEKEVSENHKSCILCSLCGYHARTSARWVGSMHTKVSLVGLCFIFCDRECDVNQQISHLLCCPGVHLPFCCFSVSVLFFVFWDRQIPHQPSLARVHLSHPFSVFLQILLFSSVTRRLEKRPGIKDFWELAFTLSSLMARLSEV